MARKQLTALLAFLAAVTLLAVVLLGLPGKAQAQPTGYSFDCAKGGSYATKGAVWLNPALLAKGRAAWGVVQHEFAHQIDFFMFDATVRARLTKLLRAKTWWAGRPGLRHSQLGCERFASTLAWAYWPSRQNTLIRFAHAEATAMPPAKFRRLLDNLLAHA